MNKALHFISGSLFVVFFLSCTKSDIASTPITVTEPATTSNVLYTAIKATFGTEIDPTNLANYANQGKPSYITKDNTGANKITDAKATLGRVLFYDKNLSVTNTISCGSCHKQEFAFSDTALLSAGVLGGLTERHSMRLNRACSTTRASYYF